VQRAWLFIVTNPFSVWIFLLQAVYPSWHRWTSQQRHPPDRTPDMQPEDSRLEGTARRRANELVDALVIKPDGHTARRKEHGYPIANDQSARVVHLESPSAVQFDRKNAEELPLPQALEHFLEVLRCHSALLR
jgi:hypothetical protein